jgi:glycosyltransferase involved in cell wall biosynthesis
MKDSFVSVWIDEVSGWGTFPLESIKMGIPVIGLTPNLVPNWMGEDNGVWINNKNMLPDVVADFIQNWLEDNINPELYLNMEKTSENLSSEEKFKSDVLEFFNGAINTRLESFESQLNKLETI